MSDFAYAYFNSELEKLDVVSLEEILDKVQRLLKQKRTEMPKQDSYHHYDRGSSLSRCCSGLTTERILSY